ncbi:MAG: sigma-70 family RNA polymerase sigma factor [Armatimonadota bacterium]|nr:sigma-70 family RNA polymerase sigma factor [bacterium]
MLSDQQIIGQVIKGKAEMFGELVARYQTPVFRLAFSILADRAEAEDAAQEVFIRAYSKLSSYTDSGKFWGWLRRITVNICLDKIRPYTVISLDDVNEIPAQSGDSVYESVACSTEATELRETIYQLPPAYRSVIVLKYLEDMNYAEIAEMLGESIPNVRVRIHRAKKMLRERMKVCAQ